MGFVGMVKLCLLECGEALAYGNGEALFGGCGEALVCWNGKALFVGMW